MLRNSPAFSGFSVNDQSKAQEFYSQKLGLEVKKTNMGLEVKTKDNTPIFIYEKSDHQPATFTILNFVVEDIDKTIDDLSANGVEFEHYGDLGDGVTQDAKGVLRGLAANMGPDIAWFKDPAGNVLSILQNK